MTGLEQRYRRVLRMLPASYRQAWEEDMVATFLASTDTDYLADSSRPSWSEVASVARLAVRLRVGRAGVSPLSVAWEEVVQALRLVALGVLLLSAVVATWTVWRNPWLANEIPWIPPPADVPAFQWGIGDAAWTAVDLLWVAAYLALVFGRWRAARLFTVLAFVPFVGFAVRDTLEGSPVLGRWFDVLVTALLLLTLAAFHLDTPPVRPRPWLIAFAVGVALTPRHRTRDLDPAHGQPLAAGLAGTQLCSDRGRGAGLPGRTCRRAQPRAVLGARPRAAVLGHGPHASRSTG